MKKFILVLDAGTTSIKSLLYDENLDLMGVSVRPMTSLYPGPRLVEQDPELIYRLIVETGKDVLNKLSVTADEVAGIGITNQRTSWMMWDGLTQKPLCNLITWQDTRGVDYIDELVVNSDEFNKAFPGLAPYLPTIYTPIVVGATKKMIPGMAEAMKDKNTKYGNVDAWLLYKLTNGQSFATSPSTASNCTMMEMISGTFDTAVAEFFGMRKEMFPEIKEENAHFGTVTADVFGSEIPVCAMVADQQAAMFAQGCFTPNVAKCTNGTGTFVNVTIGEEHKSYGNYFTSIAWKLGGKISYMFEASSFTTGSSVEWAQNQLELFSDVTQLNADAASVDDSDGVYFVPALGGLPMPYGDFTARGSFMGIGPSATRKHFARAVLESVAFAAADLINSFIDLGIDIQKLSVSGGTSNSNLAVQLMSNLLKMEVSRPSSIEATGYGTAAFAATNLGWKKVDDFKDGMKAAVVFSPNKDTDRDAERFVMWKKAVDRSLKWLV